MPTLPPAMFAPAMQSEQRDYGDNDANGDINIDGLSLVIDEQLAAVFSESESPGGPLYPDPPSTSRTPLPPPSPPTGAPQTRFASRGPQPPPAPPAGSPSVRAGGFDPEALRPGMVLAGKYRVDRVLGRLGRGAALQVVHIELGHHGVLKYLLPEASVFPEAVAHFSRGARSASRIQSEHAARITDVGRLENGSPYVVSELLRGSTLREISRVRGPLSVAEAVDAVLQAGEAVAEAHALGIVHQGLNPSNLVLVQRSDGTALVKVSDFGVAESMSADGLGDDAQSSGAGPSRQTLAYLAPEQLRRAGDVDARTDIWSLGLILHELLTGVPVYRADTIPALVAMIAADPAPALGGSRPDVSTVLEYAVLCCLEKDRAFRHANIAELAIALRPFASPDGQFVADRIVKILARATRPAPTGQAQALVRVRTPAPTPVQAGRPPIAARGIWVATLISIGGIVGATLGATIAVLALLDRVPSFRNTSHQPAPAAIAGSAPAVVAPVVSGPASAPPTPAGAVAPAMPGPASAHAARGPITPIVAPMPAPIVQEIQRPVRTTTRRAGRAAASDADRPSRTETDSPSRAVSQGGRDRDLFNDTQ